MEGRWEGMRNEWDQDTGCEEHVDPEGSPTGYRVLSELLQEQDWSVTVALGSQSGQEACLTSDSKAAIFRKGESGRSGGSHKEQEDNCPTAGLGETQLPLEKR